MPRPRFWLVLLLCLASSGFAAGRWPKATEKVPSPFEPKTFLRDWVRTSLIVEVRAERTLFLDGVRTKERLGAFRDELSFTDVEMLAEFQVERHGRSEHSFALAFASTDSLTYHALRIERTRVSLVRVAGGKTADVLASQRIRDDEGEWHRLRVSCRDGLVYAYYQIEVPQGKWQRLIEVRIPEPPAGRIGLLAEGARVHVRGLVFRGKEFPMQHSWRLREAKEE